MFFSFDGIDGGGKSTQMERFVAWLESHNQRVVTCRDPGSTALGETLRDILLHSGSDRPIGPKAEMLLYMAARAQLVEEVIEPAIKSGAVVVSDRYLLANLAYQAHAGGVDRNEVAQVGQIATAGRMPDRVFLLDIEPAEADRRRGRERDRMESRGEAYRSRLREGFLAEAQHDEARVTVIDANASIEAVHSAIIRIAQADLGLG